MDKIILLHQPKEAYTCAQHTVAMLTGTPVDEVIKLFGHSHASCTKDIISALKQLGYASDARFTRYIEHKHFSAMPEFGIVRVTWYDQYNQRYNMTHVAAICDGYIYDSCLGKFHFLDHRYHFINTHKDPGRITSFLPVKNKQ